MLGISLYKDKIFFLRTEKSKKEFSVTNYGRQYDLGYFLKVSNHDYEDIYLTWKYVPWIPNYKHFWVIYKNMFIRKLNRKFLLEQICKQKKIPEAIERIIKKFLLSN